MPERLRGGRAKISSTKEPVLPESFTPALSGCVLKGKIHTSPQEDPLPCTDTHHFQTKSLRALFVSGPKSHEKSFERSEVDAEDVFYKLCCAELH